MVYFTDARQGGQTRAITGDRRGEFYIWNVGTGQVCTYVCVFLSRLHHRLGLAFNLFWGLHREE